MPFGTPDKCPKCNKSVYLNEQVLAAGAKWHKMCFKCSQCNKMLDTSTVADHQGSLFCKSCYGRNFGLKGYGYGQGAGVLSSEAGSGPTGSSYGRGTGGRGPSMAGGDPGNRPAASFGGGNKCPRCGKTVYMAEEIKGAGQSWHKSCFNCQECHKRLDSTTVADKDGEIYCKGCYGKNFGPKGFGFGQGAGALTRT